MGHIYVEDIERLEAIKEQIKELVEEAEGIVQGAGGNIYNRAKSYWIPELLVALDKEHGYCAGCMCTMENTISEMRKEQHEEDDDYEEDDDACPGCGFKPGDGANEECDDPEGCGFYKEQEQNVASEAKSSRFLGRFEIIQELRATVEHFVEFERSELNHFELQKLVDEGYVVVDDVDGDCFSLVLTQKGEKAFIE